MLYDHLSAHSLLAKLGRWGWLMRMRLAWKKSQTTLDTSKRLHRIKTWSTGSAGKETCPNFCLHWDCGLGKVQVCQFWGWGASIITQILHRYPFTRPPSRVYFCPFREDMQGYNFHITQILHGYPFETSFQKQYILLPLSMTARYFGAGSVLWQNFGSSADTHIQ